MVTKDEHYELILITFVSGGRSPQHNPININTVSLDYTALKPEFRKVWQSN
jgi:hypothetical protein